MDNQESSSKQARTEAVKSTLPQPGRPVPNRAYPGALIVVEGTDGSGKSTQLYLLKRWLEIGGYRLHFTEWNSSPLVKSATRRGKQRRLLTPTTFSLLHAADFADRCERQIMPLLRILSGRPKLKYYEAGMDLGLSYDRPESFRLFQARILDGYDKMVESDNFVELDGTLPVNKLQKQMRDIVASKIDLKRFAPRAAEAE